MDPSDEFWLNDTMAVRKFLELLPMYERLAEEVAYILERAVRATGVQYAHVLHRAKNLNSFCEKAARKRLSRPLDEVTDLAGVRITYLYLADRHTIESLIANEFEIIEKTDTIDKAGPEQFGYGALHYLVRLNENSSGARYDELKNLVCEIQVRTILQDAWAIVAHHLSYKQESDVPSQLRRKLNALSGLFETADDKFDELRMQREAYSADVKRKIANDGPAFMSQELNLENLIEYLGWRFPGRKKPSRSEAAELLAELTRYGYTRLEPIDSAVSMCLDAVMAYESKYPPTEVETMEQCEYAQVGAVRMALAFAEVRKFPDHRNRFDEFRHLVKKAK